MVIDQVHVHSLAIDEAENKRQLPETCTLRGSRSILSIPNPSYGNLGGTLIWRTAASGLHNDTLKGGPSPYLQVTVG